MNGQQTSTDRSQSSGRIWSERLVATLAGGLLTSAVLLWTSDKQTESQEFQVRMDREAAVRESQAQLLSILGDSLMLAENDFQKVVFLGALHGNFGEQFNTRPIFEAYAQQVQHPVARRELRRLAQRVARRQSEYIRAHGGERATTILDWPNNEPESIRLAGHELSLSLASKPIRTWDNEDEFRTAVDEFNSKNKNEKGEPIDRQLVDVTEDFIMRQLVDFTDQGVDDVADVVEVCLKLVAHDERNLLKFLTDFITQEENESGHNDGNGHSDPCSDDSDRLRFEISYMDSPYIDNIWLFHGDGRADRIAVQIRDIDNTCLEHDENNESYDPTSDDSYESEQGSVTDSTTQESEKESGACENYLVDVEVLHFPDDLYLPVERPSPEELVSGSHSN